VDKSDFRKSCILKLRASAKIAKLKKDIVVSNKLERVIKKTGAKNVLLYIPFKFEVNISKLINKLRFSGKYNIFVPYMKDESFVAVKYRLPLKIKKFGIKEPSFSHFSPKIDVVIVPVIGIDGQNKRVGFGLGMYDRYFEKLRKKPFTIFVQLTLCKTTRDLCEAHDIQADSIITYN